MASSLTAPMLVLRSYPAVAALDHVATGISSFLDASGTVSLAHACSFGSIRLLDRIWENSDVDVDKSTSWSLCQHLRADIHYYRFQFTKALLAAVARGDVEVVQWVLDHFSHCTAGVEVVEKAARHGRLEILELLLDHGEQEDDNQNTIAWGGEDIANAIAGGHGDVARWLYVNVAEVERSLHEVLRFAVKQGDMPVIQWLLDDVYNTELRLPPPSIDDAAAGGHMEILQWIFEQGHTGCSDHALEGAAKNGRLDMVEWLVGKGIVSGARAALQAACTEGHLPIVQWLLEHNLVQYPHFAIGIAFRQGHLDIAKYLYAKGMAFVPTRMMVDASEHGHLHVVQWLLEDFGEDLFPVINPSRVGPSIPNVMDRAAGKGHLHILKYLHSLAVVKQREGKREWPTCSNWALGAAASMGHIEIIEWLCSTYPQLCFPPYTTTMAARNGQLEVLQWLGQQSNIEWSSDAMDSAAENGHLSVVKWLHENRGEGCTTSAMNYAAREGHLKVVRWLQENRSEGCTTDAMDFAVDREHFELLLFLRATRTEGCTGAAKVFAQEHQQSHILEWLEEHYPDG